MSELKLRPYFTPNDPEFKGKDDAESIQNAVDKVRKKIDEFKICK